MALPERRLDSVPDRRSAREIRRIRRREPVEIARVQQEAVISAAKEDAYGYVGTVALAQTHALGSVEAAFAAQQPHNAHRLAFVADRFTEAIASEAVELKWRLR